MPAFSFLKAPRRDSQQLEHQDVTVDNLERDSPEKVQQRRSKRAFFRSLLVRKHSLFSDSKSRGRRKSHFTASRSSKHPSPIPSEVPTSPMSDRNKPLPPAPLLSNEAEPPPTQTAPIKLARIISPIAPTDLHNLFSGAPQFFARSEGHYTGAPHPSVAFPWNVELDVRDLCDHAQIHDEAWGSVTAWPHITLPVRRNPEALEEHHEKIRAHFLPRCRERPNMLSMQGIERGTIGFQGALEMGAADALEAPNGSTNDTQQFISDRRREFLNGKDGLRPIADSMLIDRLLGVSKTYHEDPLKHRRPTVELYTELFTQVLFPPSKIIDAEDPYSLQVQIEVLIDVLAAPSVWVDFSLVEWRIRLGQILWGASPDPDSEDEIAVNNEIVQEPGTQKYWLLVQLLLASELLIRLDAISMNIEHGLEAVRPAEIRRFDKNATTGVKWSLILARAWLENIRIERTEPEVLPEQKPTGWLGSLTGGTATITPIPASDALSNLKFHGRHQKRQLSGLVHFARTLGWPNLEVLSAKVSANGIAIVDSLEGTPSGSPLSISAQRANSYFPDGRPVFVRGLSSQRSISAAINPRGWLTNSYVSGLVLPGEGMGHFLISTLLENDQAAISKLGEQANLYGGFTYGRKSFWSTSCVVGRVLAAQKSASECMGWISSDVIPRGAGECWVDIDVEIAQESEKRPDKKARKPRIWHKTAIEHDGNVLGGADASTVLPGDFVIPPDESIQVPPSVILESLDLFAAVDSDEATPMDDRQVPVATPSSGEDANEIIPKKIQTYSAMMNFSVEVEGVKKEINIALNHDVLFVTAHPCVASPFSDILKSPVSPTFKSSQMSLHSGNGTMKSLIGHPLHKAFTYTKLPISYLITSTNISTPFSSLLSPPETFGPLHSSTHTTSSGIPKVLVIDCTDSQALSFNQETMSMTSSGGSEGTSGAVGKHRFGSDLEMLARALCAERGWNALVSRRGRSCLACGVREAGALGWKVLIRVG